ncbi:MAG: glycosyltransferase family 4 protein [Methanothrix sp.]|nr:glycosyltransferase family 4 protein [Methanothrix sp.]
MKIAFIYYDFSSFVKQDYEILSRHFTVEKASYRTPRDIFKIARVIFDSDITYSWFASGHSFIAVLISKMLGKRSIVVAGGYDVAYEPEINYGQYTLGRDKRLYTDYVLKNADLILAVSKFTQEEVLSRTKPRMIKVIYNGIDTDKFVPGSGKEDLVMTVASGTKNVIKLKGIDTFAKAAKHIPETRFLVLGLSDKDREYLAAKYPAPNLQLRGYMSQRDLIKCYQKAHLYCQLSYRESFGVALAEAMACGCVPVVAEKAALPEVAGDTGIYVPYDDEKATAKAIIEALRSDKGLKARERVNNCFSVKKRETQLLEAINMNQCAPFRPDNDQAGLG